MVGWLKRRQGPKDARPPVRQVESRSKLCDVCNGHFDPAAGYYLSNREVAVSERYWEHSLGQQHRVMGRLLNDEAYDVAVFAEAIKMRAADRTAWAVCETCSEYFVFDRDEARVHALNETNPAPMDKLTVGQFVLFAALGFQRVHGRWPANVERMTPAGSCSFCGKQVYGPETVAKMKAEALARLRAEGVLDAPTGEPELYGGEEHWTLCTPCMAVLAAKQSRQQRA